MIRVKQQLKAFYKAQGMTGKRLKRAVWADYAKAMSYCKHNPDPWMGLSYLFVFMDAPEGHSYWHARSAA